MTKAMFLSGGYDRTCEVFFGSIGNGTVSFSPYGFPSELLHFFGGNSEVFFISEYEFRGR